MLERILDLRAIDRRQLQLGGLVLFTGLVMTLQTPEARDATADLLAQFETPTLSNTLEMRPGGPPPWMDSDQFLTDDGAELEPVLVTLDRDGVAPATDLRERPQR